MSRIGRYAIRKFLGEGGMGLVYLAEREDLGSLAGGNPDEAETGYLRALEIYRATYQGKHSRVGVAKANLAGVYLAREEYARAEQLFRDAIALYSEVLPHDHLNTGIARIRLGRTLLRRARYDEAEAQLVAGYDIVSRSSRPSMFWLRTAREDLANVYETLNQAERAARYRADPGDSP